MINPHGRPLAAAYQLHLVAHASTLAPRGHVKIVGVENGEAEPFRGSPPYGDHCKVVEAGRVGPRHDRDVQQRGPGHAAHHQDPRRLGAHDGRGGRRAGVRCESRCGNRAETAGGLPRPRRLKFRRRIRSR